VILDPNSILFDADPDPDQGRHDGIKTRQGHTERVTISLAKPFLYDDLDCPRGFLFSKLHEAVFLNPNFYFDADPDPELSGLASKTVRFTGGSYPSFLLKTLALSYFCRFFQ
jgi:hypothetical protein